MKRFVLINLLFTICYSPLLLAQDYLSRAPKILSPNATSMEKFGEIPVSLFTGAPDINIPLHTISYAGLKVPLTLRYHSGLVKPSILPGWVGMGWDLDGIGRINRQVRYQNDENDVDLSDPITESEVAGGQYFSSPGYVCGSNLANDYTSWSDQENLKYYFDMVTTFNPTSNTGHRREAFTDVMADEFSFDFLGHSGKFYYCGPTKGWQVFSDEPIKVVFDNDFMYLDEIREELRKHPGTVLDGSVPDIKYQSRMFKKFTLITSDGTQFVFGGNDAIEFSLTEYYAPLRSSLDNHVFSYVMEANSWMLKKIIDPTGNQIEFQYEHGNIIFDMPVEFGGGDSFVLNGTPISNDPYLQILPYTPFTEQVNTDIYKELLQTPLYLKSIITPNEIVSFSRSNASCLKFSDDQILNYRSAASQGIPRPLNLLFGNNLPANLSNTGPQQLDKITISTREATSSLIKEIDFAYSTNPLQRLTLNSVTQTYNGNNASSPYIFEYNSSPSGLLSTLYDGNFGDHWGYYNNTNIDGAYPTDIFFRKQPNSTAILSGLINRITYPTGGSSRFTWEIQDYSKVVSLDRQSLTDNLGTGGGVRISMIQNYASESDLATEKKYYYKTGFNSTIADVSSLPSSGILNCLPKYVGQFDRNGLSCSYVYFNSYVQYSANGQGSPVGYPEVVEVNKDGSYTKYFYTSYEADLNNVTHWDQPPLNTVGWILGVDAYVPTTSLERERGKLVGVYIYNSNDVLLKKTSNTYRQDNTRFNDYINWIEFGGTYTYDNFSGNHPYSTVAFGTACKRYKYKYYQTSKSVTTFDQNGNNPLVDVVNYSYNSDNQITSESRLDSKNNSVITTYQYPKDLQSSNGTYLGMVNKNIISPVILKSTILNNVLLRSEQTNYSLFSGVYFPQSVDVKIGNNNSEQRLLFNKYDVHGNLIEQQKPDNIKESYQWGYNGQYPIVKVLNAANNYSTTSTPEPQNIQSGIIDTYNPTKIITLTSQTTLSIATTNSPLTSYGYLVDVTITGALYYKNSLCSSYGQDCTSPSNITITNIPPGTYTIHFNGEQGPAGNGISYSYFNTGTITTENYNGEFFYEGFEENTASEVVEGLAHTGTKYWNGNYTCSFNIPNSKSYLIQWWSYQNFKWTFNQQSYINGMTLTGLIDDIRIFPTNALMSTYTYKPLIGMTSQIDANNHITYYEYDALGRLQLVKGQDGNIIKTFDYHYKGQQ